MSARRKKFPDEVLRIGLDYSLWLDPAEVIVSVAVTNNAPNTSTFVAGSIVGSVFTANAGMIDSDGKKIIYYAKDGVVADRVSTFVEVVTNANRKKEDVVVVTVKEPK